MCTNSSARTSQFLRNGVAPMYWMGYEQPYVTDVALSEDRYEKNLQWFATAMLPYGYDMFCTDGWIEGAGPTINQNGYITRYNASWQHDFSYWMKRANGMGIELGVYYNPLWISSDVVGRNSTVKGKPGIKVASLRGSHDFNGALYWCDPDKEGAEEYIKGYVRHFIDLGFKFLRCDFLCNFHNSYGEEKYAKALRWISEEAGDDIIVSLVMPNSYNNNKTETPYGDMFRISADCFGGGWDFISARGRGRHNGGWPQWENLFDGFVYFSSINRNSTMMDGDFVRLNTCKRPEEKAFWISLLVMAGSPIAIADQYNTIGADTTYYRNRRILELVKEGFHGKPLSTDLSNKEQSSIWYGKRNATTYVAAFFNREDKPVTYSLPIYSKLGFRSAIEVTDLWTGEKLINQSTNLTFRLNPHECRMVEFRKSVRSFNEEDTSTHLYGLGMAFGLWDSQYPWEMEQAEPGIYVWEGDIKHYNDNKQFKFCLNEDIWQKTYYLTPTVPICVMDYGKDYPMTKCSELTGDLKDYFWGVKDGVNGRHRITVDMDRQTVRLDALVPQIYAVGSCFDNDTRYGHNIPRIDGSNVFCHEGPLSHPTDNKAFRFTLGRGKQEELQCLEPASSSTVMVSDGRNYPMRLCSKAEGNMKGNYWNVALAMQGYKRLVIDADSLLLKVHGLGNLFLNGEEMQQTRTKYIYSIDTELHYTASDICPVQFTTLWDDEEEPKPLQCGCFGVPAEADGLYRVTFNTLTLQVTADLLMDTDGIDAVPAGNRRSQGTAATYDLMGRKTTAGQHGIYITGGRKVVK